MATAATNYGRLTSRRTTSILAVAAALGVDDVLYDYVRTDLLGPMVVPGLEGDPADAVVQFLVRARQRLIRCDTFLGASVFGIAATQPAEIAQDVPRWRPGGGLRRADALPGAREYGVADPEREPYAIVRRSLLDFRRAVRGSGARVVPWLKDFSLGVRYGVRDVRAQIDYASRRRRRVPALGSAGHVRGWSADAERAAADDRLPRDGAGVARGSFELLSSGRRRSRAAARLAPNEFGVAPCSCMPAPGRRW